MQEKAGCQAIVDIATLTGACMVALGTDVAGLFTPTDAAAANVNAAAKSAGGCWLTLHFVLLERTDIHDHTANATVENHAYYWYHSNASELDAMASLCSTTS